MIAIVRGGGRSLIRLGESCHHPRWVSAPLDRVPPASVHLLARRRVHSNESRLEQEVSMATVAGVDIRGAVEGRAKEILTPEALEFVGRLQREFNPRREKLLRARSERAERLLRGERPTF